MSDSGNGPDGLDSAHPPLGGSPAASPTAWAVLDIDGVLADVRHRLHHLDGARRDWGAFFAGMDADPVLAPGREVAQEAVASGLAIAYLTGRPERYRSRTDRWLRSHGLPPGDLRMRPDRDRRPAREFKIDALTSLAASMPIAFLLDDDEDVVRAARAAGFTARQADWLPRSHGLHEAQETSGRT